MRKKQSQRILIFGPAGAGKSTLSKALAKATGIPAYHLDCLYWLPGWKRTEDPIWYTKLHKILTQPSWIIEGMLQDFELRAQSADTIYVLDFPLWLCLWRATKRTLQHKRRVRECRPKGCPDRLSWLLFKAILKYYLRRKTYFEYFAKHQKDKKIKIFKSPRELDDFLRKLHK